MMNTNTCFGALAIALVVTFGAPSLASAQQIPDWTIDVQVGKPLFVTLQNGDRLEGFAGSVSVNGIEVATPAGVKLAPYSEIRVVKKRDSIWNGVWTGAGAGFGLGLLAALGTDCGPYASEVCKEERSAFPVGGAFWGAMLGWGIDAAVKGRTTVFETNGTGPKVSLAATPKGVTARVSIAW